MLLEIWVLHQLANIAQVPEHEHEQTSKLVEHLPPGMIAIVFKMSLRSSVDSSPRGTYIPEAMTVQQLQCWKLPYDMSHPPCVQLVRIRNFN